MDIKGFSLVELIVVLAIAGIIATVLNSVSLSHLRTYTTQIERVHTQQTLRATLCYLVNKIRMAGYKGTANDGLVDPLDNDDADRAGILLAQEGQLRITADLDNSGFLRDSGSEDINIRLSDDSDGNGVIDGGIANHLGSTLAIQFNGQGGYQPIAEGISGISFTYMLLNDDNTPMTYHTSDGSDAILWVTPGDGSGGNWLRLDVNGDGVINAADNNNLDGAIHCVDTGIPIDANANGVLDGQDYCKIGAVKITLLGVVKQQDRDYLNTNTYVVGRHIITANDHLRRRVLSACVTCRNMAL